MNTNQANTTRLIFDGTQLISLPSVADSLCMMLRANGTNSAKVTDAALTTLQLEADDMGIALSLGFEGDDTVVTIEINVADATQDDMQQRLAKVSYLLASHLPVAAVQWADAPVRIPRAAFVQGLAALFPKPEERRITPRRVRQSGPSRPRGRVRAGDKRFDAHVLAYEAMLRDEIRVAVEDPGANDLRDAVGALPIIAAGTLNKATSGDGLRAASMAFYTATLFLTANQTDIVAQLLSY